MDYDDVDFRSPLFPRPILGEVRAMLTGGLSTLRECGWTQEGVTENEAGQVCAIGGMLKWMRRRHDDYSFWSDPQALANYGKAKRLLDSYASEAAGRSDVYTEVYNDEIATSQADIEKLYEKALANL